MIRLALFSILLIFTACNPCKRIQRIATKHPDCFKALNEIKSDTGSVKIADRDSFVAKADSALAGLQDTVNKYLALLADCNTPKPVKDSLTKKLKKQIVGVSKEIGTIIETVPCLTDTVTFNQKDGAVVKLWQEGKEIKYSLSYPHINYELKETGLPWWVWLLIGYGLCMLTFAGLIIWSKT